MAAAKQSTPARIALAWLLAQRPSIVPTLGATTVGRPEDNLPAAEMVLTPGALREIDAACAGFDISGAPLSAALDAAIDR